jgi:hypothetical protein
MAAFPFPSPFPVLEFAVVAPDFLVFLAAEVLVEVFLVSALDSSFWNRSFGIVSGYDFSFASVFLVSGCGSGCITVLVSGTAVSAGSGATSSVAAARLPG